MPTDLVDHVTAAIFACAQARGLTPATGEPDDAWREIARAAVGAVGDPTSRMVEAGRGYAVVRLNADEAEIWRVMARAALEGDKPARRGRVLPAEPGLPRPEPRVSRRRA